LSSNAPASPADFAKQVAGTRYLRTTAVHIRPGKGPAFEEILKDLKTAREKSNAPITVLVSQSVAGQEGTVYYVTTLANSMAGFDGLPTVQQSLGDSGYEKFLKDSSETVADTEVSINRFVPELSNAPEQIAQAAPDFWMPKAEAAVNAKTNPIKKSVVNASESTKTKK
jgi:hypothetical protein